MVTANLCTYVVTFLISMDGYVCVQILTFQLLSFVSTLGSIIYFLDSTSSIFPTMLTTLKCRTRIRLKRPILLNNFRWYTKIQGTYRKDALLPRNGFGLFRDRGGNFFIKYLQKALDKFTEELRGKSTTPET